MTGLNLAIRWLDAFTDRLGRLVAWFSVLMVLVTCYIVVSRYIFNTGSIAIQESVIYLNGLLFMLCSGFTLQHNGHVRVDIFYSRASARTKARIDLLGSLLLLMPVCVFIVWSSWDYVMNSWSIREQSGEAGGLPLVYILKSLILAMGLCLILQGIAEFLRNFRFLYFNTGQGPEQAGREDSTL